MAEERRIVAGVGVAVLSPSGRGERAARQRERLAALVEQMINEGADPDRDADRILAMVRERTRR